MDDLGLGPCTGGADEQPQLHGQRPHRRLRTDHHPTLHRPLSRHHYGDEDRCLLPLLSHYHPDKDGCGARHPQPALPQDHFPPPRFLQRGAQGRHHCPYERRCAGSRVEHHVIPRHAVQESHPHHHLFLYAALHLVAAHAVHHRLRAHLRLLYGHGGTQAEAPQH